MFQFAATTRQWAADFELKSAQERLTQYTEAIKSVGKESSQTTQIAAITTLQLLGVEDPTRFHLQASEVLTQFISDLHKDNLMTPSLECQPNLDPTTRYSRDEAPAALKVAMKAVGHPQFAAHRLNYSADKCDPARQSIDHGAIFPVQRCRRRIFIERILPALICAAQTSVEPNSEIFPRRDFLMKASETSSMPPRRREAPSTGGATAAG
jgi:hypothetical protein